MKDINRSLLHSILNNWLTHVFYILYRVGKPNNSLPHFATHLQCRNVGLQQESLLELLKSAGVFRDDIVTRCQQCLVRCTSYAISQRISHFLARR
jgi:hypothetical protein